jgi:hypothetical protein
MSLRQEMEYETDDYQTLSFLVKEIGEAVFLADSGQGGFRGQAGEKIIFDEAWDDEFGELEMRRLIEPHVPCEGGVCFYASDWLVVGVGVDPARVRFYI